MSTTAVVTPAPAAAPVETPEVSVQERLDKSSSADLKDWRLTGKIPEPRKAETSEPEAKPITEDSATSTTSETAAAPEAARPQKKRDADGRIKQLLDKITELEAKISPNAREVRQETRPVEEAKPSTESEPTILDKDDKGEFKYKSRADFDAAVRAFDRKQVAAQIEERFIKSAKDRELQQAEHVVNETWKSRVTEARKEFTDYDSVCFPKDEAGRDMLHLPKGSAPDIFILKSPHGAKVLYEITKNHPEVLETHVVNGRLQYVMDPVDQLREMYKAEFLVSGVLPQPSSSATPVTAKKLPPPATELSARRAAPADEVESALARGDTAGYMRAMNAREAKARKG